MIMTHCNKIYEDDDMFEKINTTVIGHLLAFWAVVLNYTSDNLHGVFFAILSMACAYFHQNMYACGTRHPWAAPYLNTGTVLFTVISYVILFLPLI